MSANKSSSFKSGRFNALKSEENANIFKRSQSGNIHGKNNSQSNLRDEISEGKNSSGRKIVSDYSTNSFISEEARKAKKEVFKMDSASFPSLGESETTKTQQNINYASITAKSQKEEEESQPVPPGWVRLSLIKGQFNVKYGPPSQWRLDELKREKEIQERIHQRELEKIEEVEELRKELYNNDSLSDEDEYSDCENYEKYDNDFLDEEEDNWDIYDEYGNYRF